MVYIGEQLMAQVRADVDECLGTEMSGHAIDHVDRVYSLALRFAQRLPAADTTVVGLAALLHDVDDYKLIGREAPPS